MDPIELTLFVVMIRLFVFAYQSFSSLCDDYIHTAEVINASISKYLDGSDNN